MKDHHALLVDVTRERVVMRLRGARGISGYFGSPQARQGLEVELLMEGSDRVDRSKKLRINVLMRPFGRYRNLTSFNQRTQSVMRELKQYFAAE